MGVVTLTLDPAFHTYFIEDTTDRELYVLAELMLDEEARAVIKGLLENVAQEHAHTPRFYFDKKGSNNINILFYKTAQELSAANPLIIDMYSDNLGRLLDAWELFMLDRPQFLTFTRRRDSDIVQLIPEKILE